jgi:subfamily B ATP-binding cassette protein HlyB/CyaB
MLLRFHGIGADPAQICHRFGTGPIGIPEILLCAREFGLKARSRRTNWTRLVNTPLPAIVVLRDGGFLLLGKVGDDKALVQSPMSPRPTLMTRVEFEAAWDGHLVLMVRRAGLVDLSRRFDITWFIGAIHKYRRLLGEVLVASFFLQMFALVSPLFFQVVIDKVLVHRTLSTLDVLIIGLVTIRDFRDHPWDPSNLPFCAYDQPDRCRAGRPAVPAFGDPANRLFSGPAGRRLGCARARAGEYP